ncbi:MAG: hypothetical protein IIA87_03370 [Nanoarchaeota archaeon]|nr:hypothetical protein [Nanoarchaeota archaeon]
MTKIIFNKAYKPIFNRKVIPEGSTGEINPTPTGYYSSINIDSKIYIIPTEKIHVMKKEGLVTIVCDEGEEWGD